MGAQWLAASFPVTMARTQVVCIAHWCATLYTCKEIRYPFVNLWLVAFEVFVFFHCKVLLARLSTQKPRPAQASCSFYKATWAISSCRNYMLLFITATWKSRKKCTLYVTSWETMGIMPKGNSRKKNYSEKMIVPLCFKGGGGE